MKYALIGCGRIAVNHISAAVNNKLNIIAVCDVIESKMEALLTKSKLNKDISIKKYTDYKQMLSENNDIELISIATESGLHAEIALYCIEQNINVIIEKPMAMSIADADRIIAAAEKHNVKVAACHQNRFNIAIQKMRQALEAGRLGKISHGSIHVRWNRDKSYYDQASWRGTWAQDGGALMNQCIHGIDLLRWMMNDEIVEVYGKTKQQFHHYLEAEDLGMAVITFKNGAIGTIEGTTNVYPKNLEETLYLFGAKGTVKIGGTSTNNIDVWDFADENDADSENKGLQEATSNVYGNGHTSLFADMIEAIKKDRDLAGYNMLVTSEIKMKDVEIYDAYHNLWRIEESFRVMKSELDARPVYLQKENSIKGHFLICYVTILLTRILQFKVLDNKYSTSKICEFYRNFRLVKVNDKKYINITRASEFITELGKKLNQPLTNYYLADRQIKMMHAR